MVERNEGLRNGTIDKQDLDEDDSENPDIFGKYGYLENDNLEQKGHAHTAALPQRQ